MDLSVKQGITDDNMATQMSMIWIPLPLRRNDIICPIRIEKQLSPSSLTLRDLSAHSEKHHFLYTFRWKCKQCDKRFQKVHAWHCHFGKSKDAIIVDIVQKPYKCTICNVSFEK
jgi:hypothetical protein